MNGKPLILSLLLALTAAGAWAAPAGTLTHLSGILSAKKADGTSRILSIKSTIDEGDIITTEAESYARIKFIDGGEVVLRPNSQLKIETYRYEEAQPQGDNVLLSMLKGGLRAVTGLIGKRNREKIAYQTPTATIGIRGTHFGALFCQGDCGGVPTLTGQPPADGLHVDVARGAVAITNAAGTFEFDTGKFAYVPNANAAAELVPPERGVRVTLPGSIRSNQGTGQGIGRGGASECAVE
jgi:hypothetical protein